MFFASGCEVQRPERKLLVIHDGKELTKAAADKLIKSLDAIQSQADLSYEIRNDLTLLKEDSLYDFSTILLAFQSIESFNPTQQNALERYVQSNGGLILFKEDFNKLYWPWLYKAMHGGGGSEDWQSFVFDGGRVSVYPGEINDYINGVRSDQLAAVLDFSIGKNSVSLNAIHTPVAPEDNRFVYSVLDDNINEPIQMGVLPNGDVLFIEREGAIKLYEADKDETRLLTKMEVHTEGNYEDGLLGMTIDPNFHVNNYVYFYYSPVGDEAKQNLSRFVLLGGDSLLLNSERIILEVPVQRETCCHSAGGMLFDKDGNLYLATGDNTSSKESDGYSPLDERSGRGPFDAQKSSGNTHDLRGKILRIKPHKDGSYSIPDGNLFPKDGSLGRPEIYVMGCRNPYRFSVDAKTGYVYWGDVGPDSGKDGAPGPQSFDEWNQARKPGNFGWPYFVANNKAYRDLDFETGELGPYFDPEAPVNDSPNNNGSKELPPAQSAMIWYPYGESEEFPMLGKGSRSAMAGPIYYKPRRQSSTAFPSYYEGKLFIFDWARSWMKLVSFDANHNMEKIEPVLPEVEFAKPIDVVFGPDGAMYVLEYGANYFANNDDAKLIKIEYAQGNRLPVPTMVADVSVGAAPLKVNFSAQGSYDYDEEDKLNYKWIFGDAANGTGEGIQASFTYQQPGIYRPQLVLYDSKGDSAVTSLEIKVGNAPPTVEIAFSGNQSFYFDQGTYPYTIEVSDQEDGSIENGKISSQDVQVNFNYLDEGYDLGLLGADFFNLGSAGSLKGKTLIDNSDCRSCHDRVNKSIGPSYTQIAERYAAQSGARDMLASKIIEGGSGNWGHSMMAAHPQHTLEETQEMVDYIMAINDGSGNQEMSVSGSLPLNRHSSEGEGLYVFSARYTDKGANDIAPLTTTKTMLLRNPTLEAEDYDDYDQIYRLRPNGGDFGYISNTRNDSYFSYSNIDLSAITKLRFRLNPINGGEISVRLGSPEGDEIGSLSVNNSQRGNWIESEVVLKRTEGFHDVYFVFKNEQITERSTMELDWVRFEK
ncbi:PQQ-dependent sugar dehydrogenase [Fulvivirgaceae bacterium BMA10]|uniref:PQQ-dependent sugar dehydrogenase n=1 Tax=Splendidivirga corallicola TaxID=3051826 RepID=A0ABT8KTT1_9BACT|nr:PQQ-dependent sugar dehydrogenase [Fulvivirgaceae bacterium BMA10]